MMKIVLPLLSVATLYATFYFAYINGLHGLALKSMESRTLPGRSDPLRTVYTEIQPIDRLLTALTTFFWPMADGSNATLTVHSVGFAGTFGSAWVLVTLESWRRGNAWTIVAFPVIFGFLAQTLTFAFAAPLYAGLQLAYSVTAARPNAENIRVPRAVLNAIPFAFLVGFLVPSLVMISPLSDTMTSDLKQIIIAIWQPWPVYISILTTAAHILFSHFVSNDNNVDGGRATLSSLRKVYAVALANTVINHQIPLVLSLFTIIEPRFFHEKFARALHPSVMYQAPLPWTKPTLQVSDIGTGVHIFLRWDYIIGSAGVLLWALTLHRNAHRVILGRAGCLGLLVKVALLSVFAGPVGAAVELMWERDELVIHETGGLKPRVSTDKKAS